VATGDQKGGARPRHETRLRITDCYVGYRGKHPNGHSYTIYDIEAERLNGDPVNAKLRSFEELPVGEELDLHVEQYDGGEHGISYTLSRKGGSGREQRIKDLEARVARLEFALGLEDQRGETDQD
jgi:hypothetical protein